MTPERFGTYWLVEHIGEGGMGAVYIARRDGIEGVAGSERLCVVKTMLAGFEKTPGAVARFMDEARLVTRLSHKNICPVLDVGLVDGRPFVAMDFVAGVDAGTLFRRLEDQKRAMPPSVALYIINETLEALDYAHRLSNPITGTRLGVVHRDVSPANVMVTFEGEVKLIDFGIAKSSLQQELTEADTVVGKLKYMAPEQARGKPVDARTDVYAVGVTLYELLSGSRFFEGLEDNELFVLLPRGDFVPEGITKLSPALEVFVLHAIAGDPALRFQTCAEMLEALDKLPNRRDPGAGRALTRLLDDECAEEKREIRARLAQASRIGEGLAPPPDDADIDGGPTRISHYHAQHTELADPRGSTAVDPRPSQVYSDDSSLSEGGAFATLPVTDPSPEPVQPRAAEPSASKPSAPKPSAAEPSASKPSAPKPSAAEPSASKPSAPRASAAEPSAPKPSAPKPSAAEATSSLQPPRSRGSARESRAVELRDDSESRTRPGVSSITGVTASGSVTSPTNSTSRGALVIAIAAVLGVIVAAVAVTVWRSPTPPTASAIEVPAAPVAPIAPVVVDAGEVVAVADPIDATEPAEAAEGAEGAEARPIPRDVARARPPRPPKAGNLKEVLSYLEKHCKKRVRCAPTIVGRRASIGAMDSAGIARFVGEADVCARACANSK